MPHSKSALTNRRNYYHDLRNASYLCRIAGLLDCLWLEEQALFHTVVFSSSRRRQQVGIGEWYGRCIIPIIVLQPTLLHHACRRNASRGNVGGPTHSVRMVGIILFPPAKLQQVLVGMMIIVETSIDYYLLYIATESQTIMLYGITAAVSKNVFFSILSKVSSVMSWMKEESRPMALFTRSFGTLSGGSPFSA